jgi:hypothetical protein
MTRPWLKKHHEARRQRTVDIVKATVDRLVQEGQTVTIEAICRRSPEVDPQGKGIKKAGVLGNEEAHAYYRQHSSSYQLAQGRTSHLTRSRQGRATTPPPRIDPERDVDRARQRYLKQSKVDLVERLLNVEQAYAENQQRLARLQFELVEMQQKRGEGRQPARQS